MLLISTVAGKFLRYEVTGTLSRKDLLNYYEKLDQQHAVAGKLSLMAVVTDFRGYAGPLAFGTMLLNEHKVFRKAARYAAVTDLSWFARLIRILNIVVPTLALRTFRRHEEADAVSWLKH